jgi:hypothetical protein
VIPYQAQTNLIITLNSPHILLILKRLAEQGYAWAQVNLGYIYAHGAGVPEDYVKACAWHSISAALRAEDAKTSKGTVEGRMPLLGKTCVTIRCGPIILCGLILSPLRQT